MAQIQGSGMLRVEGEALATVEYDLTISEIEGMTIYRGILTGSTTDLLTAQGLGDCTLTLDGGAVLWLVIQSLKGDCAFVSGNVLD